MTTLVTGAGGAIGGAIVRQLLDRGTRVLAHDLRAESLEGFAGRCAAVLAGDLLEPSHGDEMLAAARLHGLDTVIAAHGLDGSGSLASASPEFVRRVLDVNALGVSRLLSLLLPVLRERAGVFVAVTSQAGINAEANNAVYCASKFALTAWIQSLAPALRAEGVRLHALAPGCTESPLLFDAQARFASALGIPADEFVARRRAAIPVGRFAIVDETAAAALYLAERGEPRPVLLAATGGEVLV